MKYTHIDQTFIDNLPTPTDKIKAEYRADNLPKGFRIEIRKTSKGIGEALVALEELLHGEVGRLAAQGVQDVRLHLRLGIVQFVVGLFYFGLNHSEL